MNYLVGIEFILYVINMKFIKHIFLLGLLLFTSGCLTTTGSPGLTIGMSANRYSIHELQGNERGSVLLLPIKQSYEGDLVFKTFTKHFADGLIRNGFTIAEDEKSANYVGFINYGLVTPDVKSIKVDRSVNNKQMVFETGNYAITSTVGKAHVDWLGYRTGRTVFDRVTEFYLYDMSKDKPNQILYSKITSTGQCNNIVALAEDMGKIMFTDYPPKNDKVEEWVDFKISTKC